MTRELLFRGADGDAAFDWQQLASELDVPIETAHALYVQSMQRVADAQRAEQLYRRWLHEAALRRRPKPLAAPAVPGRQTLVAHEAAAAEGEAYPLTELAPGKQTRVQLEYGHADAAQPTEQPTIDTAALNIPISERPAQLPAAASGVDIDRIFGRLTAQPGDRPGRGSTSTALPAEHAARLAPHIGAAAASAARIHTDDAADRVAAAHDARAVTLGEDIYFARGEYAPGSPRGDELLAHELTHVDQAQRGQLMRAAAKGITDGAPLDPAEAEAELRAKLAVIALHAPSGSTPPLAPPAGQPTSDAERAAQLAAQQQRLALAGQPAPPIAPAQPPPGSNPDAPIAHPPPKLAPPAAAAPTPNAYVEAFAAAPSKQATELWAKAGAQATTQAAADQAKFDAALQPLPAVLEGADAKAAAGAAAAPRSPAPPPAPGSPPPAVQPTPTPPPPAVTAAATAVKAIAPVADQAQLKADGQKALDAIPTTAPDVKTNPGPAPLTELAGQADPARALGDHQHAVGEAGKGLDDAKAKIIAGPGPAQLQPTKLDEKLPVPKEQPAGPMPQLPAVDGMAKLKQWNLPGNALAAFDGIARPKMEASLADAKRQMTQADARRDADREQAITDSHEKVKHAHADADKQQQSKIALTRTQIANHQADALVNHQTEITKLDQQSGERKKATLGKINDRITRDQTKAEADYQDAQRRADARKQQGEADAAKKKQDAQNKQKDANWWDQAADAICNDIKTIASDIDQALQAIGKAIGDILDAVKTTACQAIDAARNFVCQALDEFATWLKQQVDALIGSVFPQLAAALDALIDQAVTAAKAAVTAIASGLKQAVTALCNSLKASLDGVLAVFKAAIQIAATFAQAAVTGNWKLVGKMILDGIINALGIDPGQFYALIGEAEDSIEKIIANPGAFVGHLIDAVKLGFKQFGANFWTHLKDGIVQWLFGTFAKAGITMPATFDIAGIFDLVCQVLGLTWPRLRGKVVKLIGEKNTERLEFVAQYVQALITGGFAGLWAKIQQDLSSLWDMVIGGIRDWLIQSVVMAAIEKIATMWNPAGAIFELIKTAWNVYQWIRENAQRIFGLVKAVVDSISNIVAGNIGGAANFIEASLAKLVPIAIGLFADLLGLGGLADKIREIIEKVQEKIDHAIDKLIERVMKLFKGKGDGDGDGKGDDDDADGDQIGERVSFEAEDESHTQYIDPSGVPMVASNPTRVADKIAEWEKQLEPTSSDEDPAKQAKDQAQYDQAKDLLKQAKDQEEQVVLRAQKVLANRKAKETIRPDNKALNDAQQALTDILRQLFRLLHTMPVSLGDGWEFSRAQLMGAVERAQQLLRAEAASHNPIGGTGTPGDPFKLEEGDSFSSTADIMNRAPVPSTYRVGYADNGGASPTPLLVESFDLTRGKTTSKNLIGPKSGKPSSYKRLQKILNGAGINVAAELQNIERKQVLTGPAAVSTVAKALAELYALWFGRETEKDRTPRDGAYSGMLVEAMASGSLSFDEAMALHPAVPGGAQAGARGADLFINGKQDSWTEKRDVRDYSIVGNPETQLMERIHREIGSIEAWFKAIKKPDLGRPPTIDDVVTLIADHLRDQLKLDAPTSASSEPEPS